DSERLRGRHMSDLQPLDEDLVRLFDGARAELPSEAFLEQLGRRIARSRAIRLGAQAALFVLLAGVAALLTPYVVGGSLTSMDHASRWLPDLGLALNSPLGWLGSLMLGAWVLRRTHVFER